MTVTEQIDQKHQEDLQRLRGFRLLDDDFLTKCFEGDTASIELVLRIVLEKPDLKVLDVRTQVFVENLLNRSVRLDILATDSTGAKLNVEVQRSDKGAGRKLLLHRRSGYVLWDIGGQSKIFQREQGGNRDYVPGYGGYEESDIERRNERGCASYAGSWQICFRGNR